METNYTITFGKKGNQTGMTEDQIREYLDDRLKDRFGPIEKVVVGKSFKVTGVPGNMAQVGIPRKIATLPVKRTEKNITRLENIDAQIEKLLAEKRKILEIEHHAWDYNGRIIYDSDEQSTYIAELNSKRRNSPRTYYV